MSVRFVIGRAGTGKTHHCLTAIRRDLAASPNHGPRLVLLAPEQASLQMERALLAGDQVTATHRAEVLSFRRLALRILQSAGRTQRHALSAQARAMVLRALVGQLMPRLRYYRRVDRLTGFWDRLGATVGELIDEAIVPAHLQQIAEGDKGGTYDHAAAKFSDLALIYDAYLAYLGENRLDASQQLQVAREALAGLDYLRGAHLWVDGFAGFTRQEMLLLAELAGRSERTEVSLLIDPDYHGRSQSPEELDTADLFGKTQATYLQLRKLLSERGLTIDEPLLLNAKPPRFESHELTQLEAALAADRDDAPAESTDDTPTGIHLVEAADRRTEVEFAVAEVCRLVRSTEGRIRYRNIAVIVRDLEPYHDLLSASLNERNVPFFIDRRKSTTHHPVVELIRGAIAAAATSFSIESVRLLLKTGLLGLDDGAADTLENYILAHGIAGQNLWLGDDWSFAKNSRVHQRTEYDKARLQQANAARRRVVEAVSDFVHIADEPATGAQWADALRHLLEKNSVATQVEQAACDAEGAGDAELAEAHRQVWRDVLAFLDDLAAALGDMQLSVEDLAAVIEAGLSQLTLGLIPPTLDEVLVGSIERSRHPEIKAAILIGLNDGVFPHLGAEDAILNDEDRERLAGRKVHVGVTRRQRVLEEKLLFYVAATRPSEKLLVTYALTDTTGAALRPSPYVQTLRAACPGLLLRPMGEPQRTRATWSLLTARDLASGLTAELRNRPPLEKDATEVRRRWNDIYAVARSSSGLTNVLKRALASLAYCNDAALSPESVQALMRTTYRASVSELESQAACPFQHFARYALRLGQREEAELEPVDVGSVHHEILENFLNECMASGQSFVDVDESDILPRLEQIAKRIGDDLSQAGEPSSARDAYVLARSARDLSPIVQAQRKLSASGAFRPRAAEAKFGFDDPSSLPPLEINTPQGRKVYLRGLIDRVDLAEVADQFLSVVVDYKRTRDKRLNLASVYHGLSLQLLGYLLVLAERGETLAGRAIVPVGAFYVSLLQKYVSVAHPDDADEVRTEAVPRGLLDCDRLELLDANAPPTGQSDCFNVYRKKDGTIGRIDSSDAATPRSFQALLAHTRKRLGELADEVLDGRVAVSPYRLSDFSPCHWCEMRSVCRFEFGDPGLRHLDALKRTDVFAKLEESR